jgi:hypothetical protein
VTEEVPSLLDRIRHTVDPVELEELADFAAANAVQDAALPLASRLGDVTVLGDADTENAVCEALTKLCAMRMYGNLNYRFKEPAMLTPQMRGWLKEHRAFLPQKYFDW